MALWRGMACCSNVARRGLLWQYGAVWRVVAMWRGVNGGDGDDSDVRERNAGVGGPGVGGKERG